MRILFLSLFLTACGGAEEAKKTNPKQSVKDKAQSKKDSNDSAKKGQDENHNNHAHGSDGDLGDIPKGAKVFFKSPKNGTTHKSPVKIEMGVEGMTVSPVSKGKIPGTGHHHITIDKAPPSKGEALPMGDKQVKHFGKGDTSTSLELEPGKHTLHLQFANHMHISYGKELSSTIEITVEK